MFIDFVSTPDDRFVLRFWNYTAMEFENLRTVMAALASGGRRETAIRFSAPGFGVGQVVLRLGGDAGARIDALHDSVVWELAAEGWRRVHEIASGLEPGSASFRWLDERGEVSVLLSPSGRW